MARDRKRKPRLTNLVFWILLSYIIAALVWWFFSLYSQNEEMYHLRKEELRMTARDTTAYNEALSEIEDGRRRNQAKYVGEGATFFLLIMIGAVYIYRSVRRQFRATQQQQNFVMAITHELKTPISVSRLNLETLQRYQLDDAKKEKLMQKTLQEIMRLDGLINNILISSQLDGRSYNMSKEELNFSDLVKDVAQQFTTRYPERRVEQHILPDVDMNGDPLLLKLLVSNLLENANKYSSKERPVSLYLGKKGNAVSLEVKDEGMGISNDEKKNVFRKFYRVGSEQTRKTQGTGLGLYLCKKIAADHNGHIVIEDNQPQGSNFIVSFPV